MQEDEIVKSYQYPISNANRLGSDSLVHAGVDEVDEVDEVDKVDAGD